MEFSQEMKNLILDLKDQINNHSKTINKMARVVNAQHERIKKLEQEVKEKTYSPFSDIMGDR